MHHSCEFAVNLTLRLGVENAPKPLQKQSDTVWTIATEGLQLKAANTSTNLVKTTSYKQWSNELREEAQRITSLGNLRLSATSLGKMHTVWQDLSGLDLSKAYVRAKLLLQQHPLSGSHTAGEMKPSPHASSVRLTKRPLPIPAAC